MHHHVHSCMHTQQESCPPVCTHVSVFMPTQCAHIGAIMPRSKCTQKCDHVHAYMHAKAGSCSCLYAYLGAIMPMRICTHRRDHAHAYMRDHASAHMHRFSDHAHATCKHRQAQGRTCTRHMHTKAVSCSYVCAQTGTIIPKRVWMQSCNHAHRICTHTPDHAQA